MRLWAFFIARFVVLMNVFWITDGNWLNNMTNIITWFFPIGQIIRQHNLVTSRKIKIKKSQETNCYRYKAAKRLGLSSPRFRFVHKFTTLYTFDFRLNLKQFSLKIAVLYNKITKNTGKLCTLSTLFIRIYKIVCLSSWSSSS